MIKQTLRRWYTLYRWAIFSLGGNMRNPECCWGPNKFCHAANSNFIIWWNYRKHTLHLLFSIWLTISPNVFSLRKLHALDFELNVQDRTNCLGKNVLILTFSSFNRFLYFSGCNVSSGSSSCSIWIQSHVFVNSADSFTANLS